MSEKVKRSYYLFTDDQDEAFEEFKNRKAAGELDVAVAEVRQMLDPPKVPHKYVVFKVIEEY